MGAEDCANDTAERVAATGAGKDVRGALAAVLAQIRGAREMLELQRDCIQVDLPVCCYCGVRERGGRFSPRKQP